MEPSSPPTFEPAGAGGLLGAYGRPHRRRRPVGWAAGSVGIGILGGAFVGIPADLRRLPPLPERLLTCVGTLFYAAARCRRRLPRARRRDRDRSRAARLPARRAGRAGWALAAVLWVAACARTCAGAHPPRTVICRLGSAGLRADLLGMLAVLVVLLGAVASIPDLAPGGGARVRARLHGPSSASRCSTTTGSDAHEAPFSRSDALALVAAEPGVRARRFDPTTEFEQHEWIPIHLGPLNLSITKAVVYLMLGTLVTILLGLGLMRGKTLSRRQTVGEPSTRSPRCRSRSRACPRRRSAAGSRTSPRCALHLRGQPDRLHPAPADRRDAGTGSPSGASTPRPRRSR